jgi:hypothetical protein
VFRVVEMLVGTRTVVKSALYGSAAAQIARAYPGLNVKVILVESRTRSAVRRLVALLRRDRPEILLSALTMTSMPP